MRSSIVTDDTYEAAFLLSSGEATFVKAHYDERKRVSFTFESDKSLQDFRRELINGRQVEARGFIDDLKFAIHTVKHTRRQKEREAAGGAQ